METAEASRLLNLFRIVPGDGDGDDVRDVRNLLARFLANGAMSLAELQTVRDIVRRKDAHDPWACGFVAAMFLSLRGGNAFLDPGRIDRLIGTAGYVEDESAAESAAFRGASAVYGKSMLKAAATLAGDVLVEDAGRWFFQRNYNAVKAICADIERRKTAAAVGGFEAVALSREELSDAVSFVNCRTRKPYSLNEEQKAAVAKVAARRLTVVTGGPGTGKTTVVCSFLRALFARRVIAPRDVALAAPTGRAAQRMSEAIRKQCREFGDGCDEVRGQIESLKGLTIHSLLGGFPPDWRHNSENLLPHKLVIIDESSMVDVNLMRALLAALDDGCRLVLLGDGDQLPSVEAGAVLGDLVEGVGDGSLVRLTRSNRFKGGLAACAAAINDRTKGLAEEARWMQFRAEAAEIATRPVESWTESLSREETADSCSVAMLPPDIRPKDRDALFVKWAEDFGLLQETEYGSALKLARGFPENDVSLTKGAMSSASQALFDALDRSRILAVVREGPLGAKGINELLVKRRYGGRLPVNPCLKPGIPVLVTRNTSARNLFNGDVGITVRGENGMVVLFPRGDRTVACPVALLPEHELAYAMTVHKCQGSEFENVLIALPSDERNPLLNRQIVYTGITRAKKRAVIMGTEAAMKAALSRKLERDTGITVNSSVDTAASFYP